MFYKLTKFVDNLLPKYPNSEYIQVIVYCTKANLSSGDISKKMCDISKKSSNKAPEKNLDIWNYNNNRYKQLLKCDDFSEMEEIFEEAEYGGIPASSICNTDNDIILIAIGPDKKERLSELTTNLENI
ncbi:peptidyl-tRNA hydrolase [Methanohalobium sp.]|uniref:peptidyl-tRNA hydrolase n=1 Tax=Methanohalobium sp. TaxID=2837493 RepID=UPI0025E464EE|nr:peptidyl-tRNA hydrolase [Methanohalobium sp.]